MISGFLGLAAVVGTLAVGTPPALIPKPITCQPLYYCSTTYYTDSSLYTVTGKLTVNCNGLQYFYGTRTSHILYEEVPC